MKEFGTAVVELISSWYFGGESGMLLGMVVLMKEFDTAVVELISSWWFFLGGAIGVDEGG